MFVLRQIDRFGSKCEKLRVSRTSPLIPYLPTCERTSTCDVMGHEPTSPRVDPGAPSGQTDRWATGRGVSGYLSLNMKQSDPVAGKLRV